MSQKKEQKEVKSTRNNSESAVKKSLNTFKFISYRLRNGGKQRDVGTQIQFKGDGKDLSLMEMDILRHTGCQWNPILYPGFKGYIKPQDKLDHLFKSPAIESQRQQSQSPNSNHIPQFMASFNETYKSIVDPSGESSSLRTNSMRNSSVNSNLSSGFKSNGLGQSPFSNDHIKQTMQLSNFQINQKQGNAMKSLQDQIMNANFSEPKSLFGNGQPGGNSLINLSSAKKKRIMGMPLPFDYSDSKKATCFDLNLETVHEKVKDDKTLLNISDVKNRAGTFKSNSKLRGSSNTDGVKKIVNGGIQLQSIPMPSLGERNEGVQLRAKKKSIAEYSNSKHRQLDSKSSFANVAQQILNTNGSEKTGLTPKESLLNSNIKYSDLASVAPSQMMQKMAKIQLARTSNLSGSCEREQN